MTQSNSVLDGVVSFVPVTVAADSRCKSRAGGIVGSLYNGRMVGCVNYGAVSNIATAGAASYVAGIAGIVDGSGDAAGTIAVEQCHNHAPVMTSLGLGNAVAGITGSVTKTALNIVDSCPTLVIENCVNKGAVRSNMNGNCFIGGIAGVNYAATIRECTNEAQVAFAQANAAGAGYLCIGGIAGQTYSAAQVTECVNKGAVTSDKLQVNRIGGIAGIIKSGHATGNTNNGAVSMHNAQAGKTAYAGGIVGYDYNTKDKSEVTGNINNGAVEATAAGSSTLLAAGGIIGRNDVGAVGDSRNTGAVTCALHAGSLVGWNRNTVAGCAAAGSVNGTPLTAANFSALAVGFDDGGTVTGITFGGE